MSTRAASSTLTSHRIEMEQKMRDAMGEVLTTFRQKGILCDVVIKVGDTEFEAHKIILCGCSPYFRALFTGPWAKTTKQVYTVPGVTPEMMHLIINYAYTHNVSVMKDNVEEILAAADQFLVSGITQACHFFLEDQLSFRNCIGIWSLVDFYHCPELRNKVFLYILYHFEEIIRVSPEMLELSVQQLITIIENDHLNVRRENIVFEVVLLWINHLPDQRLGHISVLLPKVRLGLMTLSYLTENVMENPLIKNNIQCAPIMDAAKRACTNTFNRCLEPLDCNLLNRPRLPSAILLVMGGKSGGLATTSIEAYDFCDNRWVTVNTTAMRRAHHGSAVLNNFVYLIGGCNETVNLNSVQRFDLVTGTWRNLKSMNFSRCYVSVVVYNGYIYAMGGYNGHVSHNTMERYSPETDRWTMMAPMHGRRGGAGATTLNGKVYICGGFNGHCKIPTGECYDPNTNLWTAIAPMRVCRSGHGVTAYRNRIYAVGGIDDEANLLGSIEVFYPHTNRWTFLSSMRCPRSYYGIAVVNDQLFVVGGFNGVSTMSAVERFDEDTGMWLCAANMSMARSGLSCSVLHGLHSVVESLFPRGGPQLPNEVEEAGGSISSSVQC